MSNTQACLLSIKKRKRKERKEKIDILGYKKEKYAFMYFQIHVEFHESDICI